MNKILAAAFIAAIIAIGWLVYYNKFLADGQPLLNLVTAEQPPVATEPVPLETSTGNSHADVKLGYQFEYPEGWQLNIEESNFPDINVRKVVSLEKVLSLNDRKVLVQIQLTVKSATRIQEVKNELKKEIVDSGMSMLEEKPLTIEGGEGYYYLAGANSWKIKEVIFAANGMAYIFKYQSQDEFFSQFENDFDKIINSFRITMNR